MLSLRQTGIEGNASLGLVARVGQPAARAVQPGGLPARGLSSEQSRGGVD